jgi:hypothetical protein
MLTAGHCVNWKNDNEIGWLKFTPSYYNGEAPFGVAWATKVIYWEKPDASDGLTDHETAFDYVIAVLDRNMGDVTGYTGYKTYSSQWNNLKAWQNIGYPGPLTSAERPVITSGGAITSVQSEFSLEHRPNRLCPRAITLIRRRVTREVQFGVGGLVNHIHALSEISVPVLTRRVQQHRETTKLVEDLRSPLSSAGPGPTTRSQQELYISHQSRWN